MNEGATTETPSEEREPFQLERYGDRWAPVFIAWVTQDESPDVAFVAGRAGSTARRHGGGPGVFVTGKVELDAQQITRILRNRDGEQDVRAILLHELGHLVGLDHVADDSQLMYATSRPGVTDFAAGDLTGLAKLGRGACVPNL